MAVQRPQNGSSCVFQQEAVAVVAFSGVVIRCSVSPQCSTARWSGHSLQESDWKRPAAAGGSLRLGPARQV